jgi:molecular chaperone DnaK (HSP70)
MSRPFLGIDLGTTYTCAGTYKNGKVEIITNEFGNRTTPSYIAFDGSERYIGESAKSQLTQNLENTVYDVKRFIGRKFNDNVVQDSLYHYSYKVIEGNLGAPNIQVEYMNETKIFSPEELSSMVLQKIKLDAETFLGEPVNDVVITVPAYFNGGQRQATEDACKIAGFNVLRIINEPTAAALAYNITNKNGLDDRKVLIYDLGGGTLDVTVLIMSETILDVKSTAGNTHLGGEDFDNKIANYCIVEFARKEYKPKTSLTQEETKKVTTFCKTNVLNELYTFTEKELENLSSAIGEEKLSKYLSEVIKVKGIIKEMSTDSKIIGKIKKACEQAKKVLSTNESTTIMVESLYHDEKGKMKDFKATLSRDTFEILCKNEFQKCLEPVEKALLDAGISNPKMIDDVVLIGGSTRVPKIKQLLTDMFGQDKIRSNINPDEAVAYGATIQAAILVDIPEVKDIVLMDVTPLTIGIETAGGVMTPLIPRNSHIPCKKEQYFSTYTDNQPAVTVKIYEGERAIAKNNTLLGLFDLEGIPPLPKNVPKIKVTFEINENGIMCATAVDETSGKTNQITIKNQRGRLNDQEIARMLEDSEKYARQDREIKENIESRISLETYISNIRRTIDEATFKTIISEAIQITISDKLNEAINWLADNDDMTKEEYELVRKDIEEVSLEHIDQYINKKGCKQEVK